MTPVRVAVSVTVRRATVAITRVGWAPPLSCAPLAMLNPRSASVAMHAVTATSRRNGVTSI
jgi:hypothetical protein